MRSFLTGVVAGYGIAIPVGAIAILIVDTALRRGFRRGAAAGAGAATADLVCAGLAAIGGAALSGVVARVEEPLRIASVAVLIVIALAGFRGARSGDTGIELGNGERAAVFGTYLRFLALTLINPATVVYFAAVIIGLGVTIDMTRAEGLAFVLGAGLASLSWQLALADVGAVARVSHREGENGRHHPGEPAHPGFRGGHRLSVNYRGTGVVYSS